LALIASTPIGRAGDTQQKLACPCLPEWYFNQEESGDSFIKYIHIYIYHA
jgi:hypothetical protein